MLQFPWSTTGKGFYLIDASIKRWCCVLQPADPVVVVVDVVVVVVVVT